MSACWVSYPSIHQSQCAAEVLLLQLRITELFQISKTNIQKLPKNLSAISAVLIFGFYPNSVCSWGWECDVHDCSVTFALLLPPCLYSFTSILGFLCFMLKTTKPVYCLNHSNTESGGPDVMYSNTAVEGTSSTGENIPVRTSEEVNDKWLCDISKKRKWEAGRKQQWA